MKTSLFSQNYSLAELDGKISAVKAALMKKSSEFQPTDAEEFSFWHVDSCIQIVFMLSHYEINLLFCHVHKCDEHGFQNRIVFCVLLNILCL